MRRALALAIVVSACGGSDKHADPPSNKTASKLPDSTLLGQLDAGDRIAVCSELASLRDPVLTEKALCYVHAISTAEGANVAALRASCAQRTASCTATKAASPGDGQCLLDQILARGCKQVPLGEVRACEVATAKATAKFAVSDPCPIIDAEPGLAVVEALKLLTPAECEALIAHCPSPETDTAFEERVIPTVTRFKDEVCACADKACAEKVDDEFRLWDATLELPTGNAKPGEAVDKRLRDLLDTYRACLGKLAPERNSTP